MITFLELPNSCLLLSGGFSRIFAGTKHPEWEWRAKLAAILLAL
jgi:hypothetical protein